ncbi:sterol carrier family protein [Streptomyces sp. NPDC049954]|uniref:maleylpyruvate isomerase family mycothiol-dependent enzyme n=1 Tax=Streptomyces sp. NPDC049954 TaxID=3155779 RepID=UPI003417974E
MPPARKRLRSYDAHKTRAAVLAQFGHVRTAVRALTAEQLDGPSGLGEWTVSELVAHLGMVLDSLNQRLAEAPPVAKTLPLLDWPFATAGQAGNIDADVRRLAAAHPEPAALDGLLAGIDERARTLLPAALPGRLVGTRVGAMVLGDFLVTRCVELVVHSDDLSRATGLDVTLDRQALAACTRLLADALAVKAQGASTEVRVPPYAVVQCVEGPRHTRGTPPNVVETDPRTWLRLATGRTAWDEERRAARISASGERADLSALLPLMG